MKNTIIIKVSSSNLPIPVLHIPNMKHLPTELITEIFLNLDYFTLNVNVRRVCRRFNDIIDLASGPLLEILFRQKEDVSTATTTAAEPAQPQERPEELSPVPTSPEPEGDDDESTPSNETEGDITGQDLEPSPPEYYFTLHPCIHLLKINYAAVSMDSRLSLDKIGFVHPTTQHFTPLQFYPCAIENALSASKPVTSTSFTTEFPKLPFVVSASPHHRNLTVEEFAMAVLRKCSLGSLETEMGCFDGNLDGNNMGTIKGVLDGAWNWVGDVGGVEFWALCCDVFGDKNKTAGEKVEEEETKEDKDGEEEGEEHVKIICSISEDDESDYEDFDDYYDDGYSDYFYSDYEGEGEEDEEGLRLSDIEEFIVQDQEDEEEDDDEDEEDKEVKGEHEAVESEHDKEEKAEVDHKEK